jgi:nucleoside-diphosphate-sugar epimerase
MKFSHKKFLVTGGAGFIGSALAKQLYAQSAEIVILDNFSYGSKDNLLPGFDVVVEDVAGDEWFDKIGEVDYVLHFGAPSSVVLFNKMSTKCLNDTIVGMKNVFEFAKRYHVKKVIYPSSSSVYGNTPLPQSESTLMMPVNLYGVAKLTCEQIARLYSDSVSSAGLRIFAGYGPGEAHKGEIASVITLWIKSIRQGVRPIIFGNGSQSRDFVYIDDIVQTVMKILEEDFTGILNVGSGQRKNFNEVIELINGSLGKNVEPIHVEKPNSYFEHTLADIHGMKNLGLSPLSLEKGLERYTDIL